LPAIEKDGLRWSLRCSTGGCDGILYPPNVTSFISVARRRGYQKAVTLSGRTLERLAMRSFRFLIVAAAIVIAEPGLAQKLVDPNSVAPEFREAAEKRRAEQVKMVECQHKADEAKVLPRDRAVHINHCLEAEAGK
jgi:hypothetical protein